MKLSQHIPLTLASLITGLAIVLASLLVAAGSAHAERTPIYPNSGVATSTSLIFVNGNRIDPYTADGTISYPYKTLGAAFNAIRTAGLTSTSIWMVPGVTYTEQSTTTPNISLVIYGNNSTLIMMSGATLGVGTITFPNDLDFYDATIIGNVTESDTVVTDAHSINNSLIAGNLTVSGNFTGNNTNIIDQNTAVFPFLAASASSTVTIQPGAIANFVASNIQSVITNKGFLNLNDDGVLFIATSTRYAIDSSALYSQLAINGATIQNFGTGGGINCANSATSSPNEMSSFSLQLGVGTTNAISCNTAVSYLTGYVANTLAGTRLYATGTNLGSFSNTGLNVEGVGTIGSTTVTLPTSNLTLGFDTTASSATTTISTGKLQFDAYNSAGARQCVELVGSAFVVTSGACNP